MTDKFTSLQVYSRKVQKYNKEIRGLQEVGGGENVTLKNRNKGGVKSGRAVRLALLIHGDYIIMLWFKLCLHIY